MSKKEKGALMADNASSLLEKPIHEIVDLWSSLSKNEQRQLFLALQPPKRVRLITSLSIEEQERLLRSLSLSNMQAIAKQIAPDDLVNLIQELSQEVRKSLWNSLSAEAQEEMRLLLRYDADDAAGLMTSRYVAVRADLTVAQALNYLRHVGKVETIYYIYVVDRLRRLLGVVSLRTLVLAKGQELLSTIMVTEVIHTKEDTDQEEVAKLLESYHLLALPVVDEFERLMGIVTFDDVIGVIRQEQTEDMYKMGAMEGSASRYTYTSIWKLLRKRAPWLVLLLVAGTITTNIIESYQGFVLGAAFLIWFIPVIGQSGGNVGTQSAMLIIRGIVMGELHFRDLRRILVKELLVGLLMGLTLGLTLFLRGLLLPPGIELLQAAAVAIALVIVVLISSVIGALAPLFIHRLGFDPTPMAGPLMSTVMDVLGIVLYFQIARFILQL